jgi:hypothetical protein
MNSESTKEQPWRPEPQVVGGTAEEKQQAINELLRIFREQPANIVPEHIRVALKRLEYPKTPEDLAAIRFANAKSNEIVERYGGVPYDYPAENFHIIPPELYLQIEKEYGVAVTYRSKQAALLNKYPMDLNPFARYRIVLEEMLHLKSYESIEPGEGERKFEHRLGGLNIYETKRDRLDLRCHQHFQGIEEAVSVELVKRLYRDMFADLPELADACSWMNTPETAEIRAKISKNENVPEDEIYWVGSDGHQWDAFPYLGARRTLQYVIEQITADNPEMNTEDVFEAIARAKFSGRYLPFARLVRKSFGKYGMQVLGMMERDHSSAVKAEEFLGILRRDTLRTRSKQRK